MNRYDLFSQTVSQIPIYNLFFKEHDNDLFRKWQDCPISQRQTQFRIPEGIRPPVSNLESAAIRFSNAQKVEEAYQFRFADPGFRTLPDFFRRVLILAEDDDMLDTLLLGTLGVLSSTLYGVHGSLLNENIQPNLYIFITGAAASGKGRINLCRNLIKPIERCYPNSLFVLPGNSSDTAIYEELANNGGRGIIFESEADTLTQAISKGYGRFTDGLRCAFHNETISYLRRSNHERIQIHNPVLSVLLTGTPAQMPRLFRSPENGLFSRFIFYRLNNDMESFAPSLSESKGVSGEYLNDYMYSLGLELRNLAERLSYKSDGIRFCLTHEQEKEFIDYFHDFTLSSQQLVAEAYRAPDITDNMTSTMRRLGNICYRIMMILSTSRLINLPDEDLPDEITCHPDDFQTTLYLSHRLFLHSLGHLDELLVATKTVSPDGEIEEEFDNDDLLTQSQRELYNRLENTFITQTAIRIGLELELGERTVNRHLQRFCELGILARKSKGVYTKTQNGVIYKD